MPWFVWQNFWSEYCNVKMGKAINIDYGNIDFENDIIESLRSTRL